MITDYLMGIVIQHRLNKNINIGVESWLHKSITIMFINRKLL